MKPQYLFVPACVVLALSSSGCSKQKEEAAAPEKAEVACTSPLSDDEITLAPDEVRPIVQAHAQILGDCYNRELERNPTLQGRIDVHLVIEPSGKASQVCAGEVTLPSRAVTSCVLRAFQSFSYSGYDEQVATIYPVEFAAH